MIYIGAGLVVLAFILFAADLHVSALGALAVAGVLALVGASLIFAASDERGTPLALWLISTVATGASIFSVAFIVAVIRVRRLPFDNGVRSLIGGEATARSDINPRGFVFLRGERWKAVTDDGPIAQGQPVEIIDVHGFVLTVRRRLNPAST